MDEMGVYFLSIVAAPTQSSPKSAKAKQLQAELEEKSFVDRWLAGTTIALSRVLGSKAGMLARI
jgi:hypothetical protein